MTFVLADRIKETTTTTGTGAVVLDGAKDSFSAFDSALKNADTTYYLIVGASDWESGIGTLTIAGAKTQRRKSRPTLRRDTVLESSNSNKIVNFMVGTKDVLISYPLGKLGGSVDGDYLEGEYTPTVTCVGSGGYNLDASENTLAYTKIHRIVTVIGRVSITSISTPSGQLKVSLPFVTSVLNGAAGRPFTPFVLTAHGGTLVNPACVSASGESYVLLYDILDNGGITLITNTSVDTAFKISLNFTYLTSA